MNKKVKAQITVYAALSVFLVITLICTCIRSAAVSAGRVRVEMASVLSMEAVFAGYSSELLEEFDIFALQESEQLQSVFLQYLKKNTQTAAGQENVQPGSRTRAVSYTHLDVYKRQVVFCIIGFYYENEEKGMDKMARKTKYEIRTLKTETDDVNQYNALLRYAFQVTEQELAETGWRDDEIKQLSLIHI